MSDYFALLNEARRPWLDAGNLKERFFMLSAEVHPDRVHQSSVSEKLTANRRYISLNVAYNCLREPRERLRHLLELELGHKPSDLTNVPNDLMDLFFEIGKIFRETDAFLLEKCKASSPMIQVQLFERGQDWAERLGAIRLKIASLRDGLVEEIQKLDAAWITAGPKPLERLLEIWRLLSFYERWLAQIQERVVELSF